MANAQKQQQLQAQLGQTAGNLAATGQGNLINAATVGGNLAGQQQQLSLADINALSTLGSQQQTIAQNQQLFPLTTLSKQAELMRGYQIPTNTINTYQGSPLSAITSLGATAAGLAQPTYTIGPDGKIVAGPSLGSSLYKNVGDLVSGGYNAVKGLFNTTPTIPAHGETDAPDTSGQVGYEEPI
jgi:hypothetical protein